MDINGRTFIVTGAGSGLGRATAIELAGAGARVVCLDVDVDGGEGTAAAIGAKAEFVRADVTSEADVAAAVEQAGEALAGAVNCAGVGIAERTVGRDGPHALDSFARIDPDQPDRNVQRHPPRRRRADGGALPGRTASAA